MALGDLSAFLFDASCDFAGGYIVASLAVILEAAAAAKDARVVEAEADAAEQRTAADQARAAQKGPGAGRGVAYDRR